MVLRRRGASTLVGKGPEQDLLSAALSSLSLLHGQQAPLLFQEPELPTGFPDMLLVYPTRRFLESESVARMQLTPRHLRLLHHIYTGARRQPFETSS